MELDHENGHEPRHACTKCAYDLEGIDPRGNCPECGTPIINECFACKYDLAGADPQGNCPECGLPVAASIAHGAIEHVDTPTLRTIHKGAQTAKYAIVMFIILFVVIAVHAGIAGASQTTPQPNAIDFVFMTLLNATVLAYLYGWWNVTTPIPGLPAPLDPQATRTPIRISIMALAVVTVLSVLFAIDPNTRSPNPTFNAVYIAATINGFLSFVFLLMLWVTHLPYTRRLARLIGNTKMAGRAKHLIWSGPLIAIVGMFLLFLGPLVVLILYWNMIHYIAKDLKKIIARRTPAPETSTS